ncbi:MAG: class I SAM-dependent methyltransferase [Patescibacteria group bacterium]
MDATRQAIFDHDLDEAQGWGVRAIIRLKLFYYLFSRIRQNRTLREELRPALGENGIARKIDLFLRDDGGMFKHYAYGRIQGRRSLRGARVLVPGVGYGRNLAQLAAFRPKEIVAFDFYEYPEDWEYLKKSLGERFGVNITFLTGDFDVVPESYRGSFDAIVSDAVLEHVPDLPKFMSYSELFLKEGGVFFASFGPIWYGPSGDHVEWGPDNLFDHLLLSRAAYAKQVAARIAVAEHDSCDPGFMGQEELFSYLAVDTYLNELLRRPSFEKMCIAAKISSKAVALFRRHPNFHRTLDEANIPLFDRFCSGFYVWLVRRGPETKT